jgi:putative inorganic carbon (HCO3(-)) transporter
VFAELGFMGALVWAGLFAYAVLTCVRVRARSRDERLGPEAQQLLFTMANAFLVSIAGFVIGGSFLALALNDLTWLTFGLVAALDRVSRQLCDEAAPVVQRRPAATVPLAFRAVASYAAAKGGRP